MYIYCRYRKRQNVVWPYCKQGGTKLMQYGSSTFISTTKTSGAFLGFCILDSLGKKVGHLDSWPKKGIDLGFGLTDSFKRDTEEENLDFALTAKNV